MKVAAPGCRVIWNPVTLASLAGSCQATWAEALPAVAVTEVGDGAGGTLSMVMAVTEPSICSGNEAVWADVVAAEPSEGR